ncbi:nuclear transport factor 2 family protein [Streptomyces sp. NPDC057702]|uniref:nuclear transport factor 2 family protein n=1 Tax=unclassified Streptomyces TaxID=2593676 RepID=UPI00368C1C28
MSQFQRMDERQRPVSSDLYLEVTQFYADHMQAVDDGDEPRWKAGFAEEVVFTTDVLPAPLTGKANVVPRLRRAQAELAARGVKRRHMMSMLTVHPEPDGDMDQVRTRASMLVLHVLPGQQPAVHRSGTWDDVLVRSEDGLWLILARQVSGDGVTT